MKHFIYMDTYMLNSYISQFNDGLITNIHTEVMDQTSTGKIENTSDPLTDTSFKLSIPAIFNVGINQKDELLSTTAALTQLQSGKELIDKMFHDNAFNQFTNYLKDKKLLKYKTCSIGDYVLIKDTFEFWDLDYLLELFNDNFINFLVNSELEEYKKSFINIKEKKPNISDLKNFEKQDKTKYEEIKNLIKMCRDIMPFTKFMMINDCFVPLNDTFLRETVNSIRFKYTGKITLVGKYTNNYKGVLEQSEGASFSQIFNSLDGVVNMFLKESLSIPNYAKVITPIALFFE